MTAPPRPLYGILTVCLDDAATPANDREAYDALKAKLGLSSPAIDDVYGAMPLLKVHPWMDDQPKNSYLVLIDCAEIRRLLDAKHPNVVGWHHAAAVHSGQGPQPMSESDKAQIMKHRKPRPPKGPGV